jgi:hypothetical protein
MPDTRPRPSLRPTPPSATTDELVGLFHSADAVESAISDLASAGWDRSDLSLLAQKSVINPTPPIGGATTEQAADAPGIARAPVVSEPDIQQGRTLATSLAGVTAAFIAAGATVVTGGTALAALIGAAAAGGGAAAAVEALGQWVGRNRADFLEQQIQRGGILLWVLLRSPDQESRARAILTRHGADLIQAHAAERPQRPTAP